MMAEETRILRLPEVEALTGLRRSTIYKLMAEGEFPSSVKLTAGAVGWINHRVFGWIESRERTR